MLKAGEIKEGDNVEFATYDLHFPEFFPPYGTIGRVHYYNEEKDPDGCWVEWPEGTLKLPNEEENASVDLNADNRLRVRYCLLSRLSMPEVEEK